MLDVDEDYRRLFIMKSATPPPQLPLHECGGGEHLYELVERKKNTLKFNSRPIHTEQSLAAGESMSSEIRQYVVPNSRENLQ